MKFGIFLKTALSFILIAWAVPVLASTSVGTISPLSTYVWGNKIGWIDLAPSEGGLIISDLLVRGYAWSSVYGWINFSPSNSGQGVINNAEGVLSGFAWISGRGWLDMSGATIDSNGRFHGIAGASDSPVGQVSFDCDRCAISTDWRPASVRQVQNSGGGGFVPSPSVPSSTENPPVPSIPDETAPVIIPPAEATPPLPEKIIDTDGNNDRKPIQHPKAPQGSKESLNRPLILEPNESGTLIRDMGGSGKIKINVFPGSAEVGFTTDVKPVTVDLHSYNPSIRPIGDFFYEVSAFDLHGKALPSFNAPLKISLPLPQSLAEGDDVGVYRFDATDSSWNRISPVVISSGAATFYSSKLGRFAILNDPEHSEHIIPQSGPLKAFIPLGVAALSLGGAFYVFKFFKQ